MFNQTTGVAGTAQFQVGFNVLTDNAGTAVAGTANVTQQSLNSSCTAYMMGLDSTTMYAAALISSVGEGLVYITAGIDGNNPSILSTSYFYLGTGINASSGQLPEVLSYQQRAAGAVSSMGNLTKGDFMSVWPNSVIGTPSVSGTTTGIRMGRNSITAQAFNSLRLAVAGTTSSYSGSVVATISNTFSDSTTLNQYGEIWSIAGVQAIRVGGNSYSKVVLTRLVYA